MPLGRNIAAVLRCGRCRADCCMGTAAEWRSDPPGASDVPVPQI